ncbi:YheC/YheD family protein [Bacillus sp. S/N-304-OC-R1]|uniref:YheC/YheD family protein n=1 Tax=Bacillus sp. S/N-304-OC-R1 TaxID=2758034 RepID=UPI001C8E68DC|nr:YheC/YheD family protein [Bacillus sp. S/N-304-OC-R1]MBY0121558.1 YheC/YheD family protein [Bacillus sp. S/N-304-OC-R1]
MSDAVGKWEQAVLFQNNPLTAKNIPKTKIYSVKNLKKLLDRYDYVYVKHDTTGQGRSIYKISKRKDNTFCFNGFTIQGKPVGRCVSTIEEFHQFLNPFLKFGRLSGPYVIQQAINSTTKNAQPFVIRVHVQNLKGKWIVGGMYSKIGLEEAVENGIVNSHQGAKVISINDLLSLHLHMKKSKKDKVINNISKLATSAAEVMAQKYPCREYGLDIGLYKHGKPVIFEVNTTPSIRSFAEVENKAVWKRIMEIRKQQKEA